MLINIFINNKSYKMRSELTILQACERLNIDVPKFCYHDKLNVAGNCRMCLVEVEKSPKPVASCATPLVDNMKIFTNTPLVKKARESVLEFLLVNHPLDCPICDQGGECDLQEHTFDYASDRSRNFLYNRRAVQDKECGPIIKTIMTRCIHCTRCVRFIHQVTGKYSFGTLGRGRDTEIGMYIKDFLKTELSGNLVDLCPVGALTSKPYAFTARKWELNRVESIDCFDAIGSHINIFTRNQTNSSNNFSENYENETDRILRILPKYNEDINQSWISDKSRHAFDGLYKNRAVSFLLKKNNVLKELSRNNLLNYITKNKIFREHKFNKGFTNNLI